MEGSPRFPVPSLLLAALLLPGRADAFCGTYVSSYEEGLTNAASEVAIVRQGDRTTLTVANDVTGDTSADFAMVIPVPEILGEDQIHVVDPTVFDRLRDYSNPREVSYTCEDFERGDESDTADFDAGAEDSGSADTGADVEVEAQYVVGEYDVLILSADESTALVTWLQTNGFYVPDASAALLAEYIEGGAYFFAARVRADAEIASGQMLSPLQFSYTSAPFGLPVRIGTLNSPGEQDLRIYAITDYEQGAVAISNYDPVSIDTDCMYQPLGGETLTEYYDRRIGEAFGNVAGAEWMVEYSWGNGNCDPCTGVIPSDDDIFTVGYQPDPHYGMYYWFTRLRLRYAPGDVGQDLVLYETRMHETRQMRFIQYDERLEEHFPVCDVGFVENGGTCDGSVGAEGDGTDGGLFSGGGGGCGCDAPGGAPAGLALGAAALALAARRRR